MPMVEQHSFVIELKSLLLYVSCNCLRENNSTHPFNFEKNILQKM